MKKLFSTLLFGISLSVLSNPIQLDLDLGFGPENSPYQCVKVLEEKILDVRDEVVFDIENCTDAQIISDIQVFMLENNPATDSISKISRDNKSVNDILDLLKTDHTENGGSDRFTDRQLLIFPDFFAGKLEVQPHEDKKEIAQIQLVQDSVRNDFSLVLMYNEDLSKLILVTKKTSGLE